MLPSSDSKLASRLRNLYLNSWNLDFSPSVSLRSFPLVSRNSLSPSALSSL